MTVELLIYTYNLAYTLPNSVDGTTSACHPHCLVKVTFFFVFVMILVWIMQDIIFIPGFLQL